jgi:hypothetical protein
MSENSNLAVRCRALWAEVLCAVESRVWSLNSYLKSSRDRLECRMLDGDSLEIEYPALKRRLIATLDLKEHAIAIQEFERETLTLQSKLPFSMLADGGVYVTHGPALLAESMSVARQLISMLLTNSAEALPENDVTQFRSWASSLIAVREPRTPIHMPVEIQTETALYPAETLDMSEVGVKVQSTADLDSGNYVTVFRGTLGSFFRVVWAQKNEQGTRAGLVCLNPPLEWAELAGK